MIQTILIITSSVLLSTSILFLVLFIKTKNKSKINLEKSNNIISSLNDKLNRIKKISTGRVGYYSDSVNLLSEEDKKSGLKGEPYYFTIHVKEIERYTNGISKIELINIEVTSGYHIDQYSWVRESQKVRFSSLKKTSEIEWLELDKDLKESRKEKLNKILSDE